MMSKILFIFSLFNYIELSLSSSPSSPLRIFILVGQSNMEGKGSMEHLEELLLHNITRSTYQHYGIPGNYTKRHDVYAYFQDTNIYKGPLTVGYGMPHNENFGPELEFGWIVGDDYNYYNINGKTLLIKCSWGGKDLAVDFRPPSSGIGNYTKCDDDHHCRPFNSSEYGFYYRETVHVIKNVIANLTTQEFLNYYPSPTDYSSSYEIAGLVWFQGWNDVINPQKVSEYAFNLANLIHDIRSDLSTPNLPIVIGELGQIPRDRWNEHHVEMRHQMRAVTQQPKFVMNTRYVMTMPFVNSEGESFNIDCHYYGRADTEFYIGRSFGIAMIQMLEDYTPIVRNITTSRTKATRAALIAISEKVPRDNTTKYVLKNLNEKATDIL